MDNPLIIGKIGSPYGIKGWNHLFSYTEKKIHIFQYQPWFIKKDHQWGQIQLEDKKNINKKIIIKIHNVNDRNQAQKLINISIAINSNQLPKLPQLEYYWKDIMLCNVFNKKNKYVGKVINILQSNTNDILILQNIHKKEILIPFIQKKMIQKVDIYKKTIHINTE
ncbi:Ribosome maturation factor RimM [Buchnera aphidicola (Pterocallis alni)]|uniref:ribosome maturation factor RimM n=1 Tax=Buchnera aphidicola TaxID=9 RepID=UPI003463EE1C